MSTNKITIQKLKYDIEFLIIFKDFIDTLIIFRKKSPFANSGVQTSTGLKYLAMDYLDKQSQIHFQNNPVINNYPSWVLDILTEGHYGLEIKASHIEVALKVLRDIDSNKKIKI